MKIFKLSAIILGFLLFGASVSAIADEFSEADLKRWEGEYMAVVKKGQALWGSPDLGTNGVACGQCHPNAANTHPETYPKFQKQIGKVVELRHMINWCLRNPLEGEDLEFDSAEMLALEAYVAWERRGVPLAPGKH
jgi:cytochrome c